MTDLNQVLTPTTPTPEGKAPWQSKTLWVSALTALVPLVFPPAGVWIAANPSAFSALVGVAFAGLRLATKHKVTVS